MAPVRPQPVGRLGAGPDPPSPRCGGRGCRTATHRSRRPWRRTAVRSRRRRVVLHQPPARCTRRRSGPRRPPHRCRPGPRPARPRTGGVPAAPDGHVELLRSPTAMTSLTVGRRRGARLDRACQRADRAGQARRVEAGRQRPGGIRLTRPRGTSAVSVRPALERPLERALVGEPGQKRHLAQRVRLMGQQRLVGLAAGGPRGSVSRCRRAGSG